MPLSRHDPVVDRDPVVPLVGRCSPLPGVAVRSVPDPALQRRFLAELRQHTVGDELLLSLLPESVPEAQRLTLDVVRDQQRHLRDLLADFEFYGRLEADRVAVDAGPVLLWPWLQQQLAMLTARAERLGTALEASWRSFLPDRVCFDIELLARALQGVLDVAVQRAVVGPVQMRIAFQANAEKQTGELVVDVATQGGGFHDIELGYVFTPFVVQDGASRALLGLSIAHRLVALLGGSLSVDSPGRSVCTYRLTIPAQLERGAVWLDPGDGRRSLGPVRPPRVLFVGGVGEPCRAALEAAQFVVERAVRVEQVMARLDRQPGRWGTIVVDARGESDTVDGFVDALRSHGFGGAMVVIGARLQEPGALDLCLEQSAPELVLQAACRARDA